MPLIEHSAYDPVDLVELILALDHIPLGTFLDRLKGNAILGLAAEHDHVHLLVQLLDLLQDAHPIGGILVHAVQVIVQDHQVGVGVQVREAILAGMEDRNSVRRATAQVIREHGGHHHVIVHDEDPLRGCRHASDQEWTKGRSDGSCAYFHRRMSAPHTDLGYLERFCKGERSRIERYIKMYIEASPALFARMVDVGGANDAEELAIAAHSLRPQVNYMGAQGLFDLLTSIEQRARMEGAAACMDMVHEALDLNEKVMTELRIALGHP